MISLGGGFHSHECFPVLFVLFCYATCALIFYIFDVAAAFVVMICCVSVDRCYHRSSSHEVKTFSMLGAFFGLDLFIYG